ncbi:MAG: pyridoxamine 5'-phosphate oxidase family protein [Coriobacteriia bacterium]|nr:pyridoxamine 5'-phosphate oxidase family protein [Coriobacteriia bacterium]
MRRDDRAITDPARLDAIIRAGRFANCALIAPDGPYVVTLSHGYDAERGRLYFHVAHEGEKLDAIAIDARACVTVVVAGEYLQGECAHPYESVVMRGTMRVVTDADEKRHAIRVLVEHLEDDPETYWVSRSLDEPARTAGFTALCFEISEVTGKAGS